MATNFNLAAGTANLEVLRFNGTHSMVIVDYIIGLEYMYWVIGPNFVEFYGNADLKRLNIAKTIGNERIVSIIGRADLPRHWNIVKLYIFL